MKLHHIALIVSDKARSLSFYQNVLGFKLLSEEYRQERDSWKIDLKWEEIQLELFTFPQAPKRASYPEALGLRHLAFAVENIDEWHENLKSRSVAAEEIKIDHSTGKKFFFIQDPDEQPLEFYQL